MNLLAGTISPYLIEGRERQMALIASLRGKLIPATTPPIEFVQKFNLPVLDNYRGKFPMSYWCKWKKRTIEDLLPHKSWVSLSWVKDLAIRSGYQDVDRLNRVVSRLGKGADIGC